MQSSTKYIISVKIIDNDQLFDSILCTHTTHMNSLVKQGVFVNKSLRESLIFILLVHRLNCDRPGESAYGEQR